MISSVQKKLSYREVKSLPPDQDSKWQSQDSPGAKTGGHGLTRWALALPLWALNLLTMHIT